MKNWGKTKIWLAVTLAALALVSVGVVITGAQKEKPSTKPSSYSPVVITEDFATTVTRMKGEKPAIMARQQALLNERYDLSNRPAPGVTMTRGKPVQEGVRVKLPAGGMTWDKLAALTPEEIKEKGLWPKGFLPLPHPNHKEGGMLFPKFHIEEIKKQEGRDLTRFDLDFDLPDHVLPEFPPPIFLTTRPDLGDVSQGKLVTVMNYYELFNGILNPKQLEGLRLLVSPTSVPYSLLALGNRRPHAGPQPQVSLQRRLELLTSVR